jgi:hypothetical protein
VVRVFGANTEIFIDRARELQARPRRRTRTRTLSPERLTSAPKQVLLQLNAQGFGAPVVGTFANGRIEAWLHARPLEPSELAEDALSRRIARLLRRFHGAAVDGDATPTLWTLLREWLAMASTLQLADPARQATLESVRSCARLLSPTCFFLR